MQSLKHGQVMLSFCILILQLAPARADTCSSNVQWWTGNMTVVDSETRQPLSNVVIELWNSFNKQTVTYTTDDKGQVGDGGGTQTFSWKCNSRNQRSLFNMRFVMKMMKQGYRDQEKNFIKSLEDGAGSAGDFFPYELKQVYMIKSTDPSPSHEPLPVQAPPSQQVYPSNNTQATPRTTLEEARRLYDECESRWWEGTVKPCENSCGGCSTFVPMSPKAACCLNCGTNVEKERVCGKYPQ